jgi:photosystem II stability/assembly factor-like uncharacterized protein
LAWISVLVLLLASATPLARAQKVDSAAQEADSPETWHQLNAPQATDALFGLPSGALLATSGTSLFRSDDQGDTWTPMPLGAPVRVVAIGPGDTPALYGSGADGLYASADGGATWQRLRASNSRIVPSPADPALLYLAEEGPAEENISVGTKLWTLLRSRDAGMTWQAVRTHQFFPNLCDWRADSLAPHPADPSRVFLNAHCQWRPEDLHFSSSSLEQSFDGGLTWARLYDGYPGQDPKQVLGGSGAVPERLYLRTQVYSGTHQVIGDRLVRSDDDGATWQQILPPRGDSRARPRLSGLAYDPEQPDVVFVAESGHVLASADAGDTWLDLGSPVDAPTATLGAPAVALTFAGDRLFALVPQGPVFRLETDPEPAGG